jgi:hypothetical protein
MERHRPLAKPGQQNKPMPIVLRTIPKASMMGLSFSKL